MAILLESYEQASQMENLGFPINRDLHPLITPEMSGLITLGALACTSGGGDPEEDTSTHWLDDAA